MGPPMPERCQVSNPLGIGVAKRNPPKFKTFVLLKYESISDINQDTSPPASTACAGFDQRIGPFQAPTTTWMVWHMATWAARWKLKLRSNDRD